MYSDKQLEQGPIRFVSMIDSKPVQPPYLSLVPFKSFNKAGES